MIEAISNVDKECYKATAAEMERERTKNDYKIGVPACATRVLTAIGARTCTQSSSSSSLSSCVHNTHSRLCTHIGSGMHGTYMSMTVNTRSDCQSNLCGAHVLEYSCATYTNRHRTDPGNSRILERFLARAYVAFTPQRSRW